MNLQPIRQRLAQQVPEFRHVKGAAQFAAAAQQGQYTDQAYVILLRTVAGDNQLVNVVQQAVTIEFAVVYWVRDVSDAEGAKAGDVAESMSDKVISALLGWTPPDAHQQITYRASRLLRQERGSLLWTDEFKTGELLRKV